MILFVSGRTDIPAFYSQWFMNRIKAGFVDVRNPYCKEKVTRYKLNPKLVDCLVFCTKNPGPMLSHIDSLKEFNKYFFVTITPYDKEIEPNVPEKQKIIEYFSELSTKIGKEKVCWRYDPIFLNSKYTISFHIRAFKEMCRKLSAYTDRCIISFIDLYSKTQRNFPDVKEVSKDDQIFLAGALSNVANQFNIKIETCAEELDLRPQGITPGSCVSKELIEKIIDKKLIDLKPQHLRQHCNCLPMRDIAAYNCCPHLCKYCYANYNESAVKKNFAKHNPDSSFLIGDSSESDILTIAHQESYIDPQLLLF